MIHLYGECLLPDDYYETDNSMRIKSGWGERTGKRPLDVMQVSASKHSWSWSLDHPYRQTGVSCTAWT
jgi:hypothetical protein